MIWGKTLLKPVPLHRLFGPPESSNPVQRGYADELLCNCLPPFTAFAIIAVPMSICSRSSQDYSRLSHQQNLLFCIAMLRPFDYLPRAAYDITPCAIYSSRC